MRKSSEIQAELKVSKEQASAKGLAADEKEFIDAEVADLEKELEAALKAEKSTPAKKPAKQYTKPTIAKKPAKQKAAKVVKPKKEKKTKATKKNAVAKAPKEKSFIIFEGKKIYEDDAEYCSKLVVAWRERKEAIKKAAGKRKTKPVTQRVAANIASAVSKGIESISNTEIKKNPKSAISKMERLEKAGKEFLAAYKDILGETITQKEIAEEFEGLDRTIKEISKKFLKKKMSDGGSVRRGLPTGLSRGSVEYEKGKNYPVKTVSKEKGEEMLLDRFPNFSSSGSVSGMKKQYYGKDALLIRSGNYIYNVTSEPYLYFNIYSDGGSTDGYKISVERMVEKLEKEYPSIRLREGEHRISILADFPEDRNGHTIFDYFRREEIQPHFNNFVERNGFVIETQNPEHIILWEKGHYGW